MDKSYKKPLLLITFGVILFAAFNNLIYSAKHFERNEHSDFLSCQCCWLYGICDC